MTENVVIVDYLRTPLGKVGGMLAQHTAMDLAAHVVKAMLERHDRFHDIDEVIAGQVGQSCYAPNISRAVITRLLKDEPQRYAALESIPGYTVHRNCGSGMEALASAWRAIRAGDGRLYLVFGVESMSNLGYSVRPWESKRYLQSVPHVRDAWRQQLIGSLAQALDDADLEKRLREGLQNITPKLDDSTEQGLTDPAYGMMMWETADLIAKQHGITREDQDTLARWSHEKALAAQQNNRLAQEIIALGSAVADETPKKLSEKKCARARPFADDGTVTSRNCSLSADGAAALLVCSERYARGAGLEPLARIDGYAVAGCDPRVMGLGPVYATSKLLTKEGMSLHAIDVIELNEAFAAQYLACERLLAPYGWDPAKVNVNGGAIALSHPVGCTGARLAGTLAYELKQRGSGKALATLCIGGGQGAAMLLSR